MRWIMSTNWRCSKSIPTNKYSDRSFYDDYRLDPFRVPYYCTCMKNTKMWFIMMFTRPSWRVLLQMYVVWRVLRVPRCSTISNLCILFPLVLERNRSTNLSTNNSMQSNDKSDTRSYTISWPVLITYAEKFTVDVDSKIIHKFYTFWRFYRHWSINMLKTSSTYCTAWIYTSPSWSPP